MAEPEHNQLDDLFKKSGSDSLDDFEREALEGFNSLESQQEAHDLQKKVDQRAQKELFGKKEKSKPFVYWYAAAGLFLVVGLGAYFIVNKDGLNNKKNVAVLEQSAQVFNKPDQSAPAGNYEYQADAAKGKEQPEKKGQAETATSDLQEQAKKTDKYTGQVANEKTISGGRYESDGDLLKKAETKEPAAKALEQRAQPVTSDNLAMTQPETEKAKEEIAMPSQDQKNAGSYSNVHQEKEGKKSADANSEVMDDREVAKEEEVATGKAQQTNGDITESKAKEKHDRNRKKSNSQSAPGRAESKDVASKNADKDYKYDESKPSEQKSEAGNGTFAGAGGGNSNANVSATPASETKGSYDGGETALRKDLGEKLKQNDVNKKFDATLFINDKKQVEKVSFTKGDLSKEQQEKIEAVLKSLSKFKFTGDKLKKGFFEYKLSYRP